LRSPITPDGRVPPGTGKPHSFPPVFSSPAAPGWNRSPLGFDPGLRTPQSPATHAEAETGHAHWPGYYTFDIDISRTSSGASHLHSCTLTSHVIAGDLHHHRFDALAG
jgi:hypothetical protein